MTKMWGVASSNISVCGMWTERSDLRIRANVSTDEPVATNQMSSQMVNVPKRNVCKEIYIELSALCHAFRRTNERTRASYNGGRASTN